LIVSGEAGQPAMTAEWPEADVPFREPWQAQVFALTVHLHQRGLFTWPEWAQALSAEVTAPTAAADGSDYYHHWAAALEKMLAAKAVTDQAGIDDMAAAWTRAAHATPHGQPIELAADPGVH